MFRLRGLLLGVIFQGLLANLTYENNFDIFRWQCIVFDCEYALHIEIHFCW